jgi:hypothetical protein
VFFFIPPPDVSRVPGLALDFVQSHPHRMPPAKWVRTKTRFPKYFEMIIILFRIFLSNCFLISL